MKRKRHKDIRKEARNNNKAKIVCDDNCDISNVIELDIVDVNMQPQKIYKHII